MLARGKVLIKEISIISGLVLYKFLGLVQNRGMTKKQTTGRSSEGGGGKSEALLGELKGVAEQLGIRVRGEKLLREVGYRVRGGGCRVHDQDIVFLDRERPLAERIAVLLDELSQRNLNIETLSPSVRHLLAGSAAL